MESAGVINEIWRSVSGYPNYQVSNIGRIRRADTGTILRPLRHGSYFAIYLYDDRARTRQLIHRLVAKEFIDNPEYKKCVDHIDGDGTNNCVSNLRWVSNSENGMNQRKTFHDTSSIYKGVSWHSRRKIWEAYIAKDKKKIHLGCFNDETEAARAYNQKAIELFGEFANLNNLSDEDASLISEDPRV